MAPPPEYDKEPKAPDKSATTVTNEEIKVHTLVNDLPTFSDHRTTNSATNNEVENNKHVESLDDGQLRALLDEAIQYKCPKDREGKSSLFKELLEEVEHQDEVSEAASRGFIARGGPHANSLQDLMAALKAESASRPVRHQPPPHAQTSVSARAIHGGSLPSGVDTSFLLAEEPTRGGYLATVRCVNPPPLAERRVSASDANSPAEMELLNKSKPMFPMYTARASLEIGSGSVCSGRAVTTTTPSNQVRKTTPPHPASRHKRFHHNRTLNHHQVEPRPVHWSTTRGPPERIYTPKSLYQPDKPTNQQEKLLSALRPKYPVGADVITHDNTRPRGPENNIAHKPVRVTEDTTKNSETFAYAVANWYKSFNPISEDNSKEVKNIDRHEAKMVPRAIDSGNSMDSRLHPKLIGDLKKSSAIVNTANNCGKTLHNTISVKIPILSANTEKVTKKGNSNTIVRNASWQDSNIKKDNPTSVPLFHTKYADNNTNSVPYFQDNRSRLLLDEMSIRIPLQNQHTTKTTNSLVLNENTVDNWYKGLSTYTTPTNNNLIKTPVQISAFKTSPHEQNCIDIIPNIHDIAKGSDIYNPFAPKFETNLSQEETNNSVNVSCIVNYKQGEDCDIREYRKRVGQIERASVSSINPRNVRGMTIGKPEPILYDRGNNEPKKQSNTSANVDKIVSKKHLEHKGTKLPRKTKASLPLHNSQNNKTNTKTKELEFKNKNLETHKIKNVRKELEIKVTHGEQKCFEMKDMSKDQRSDNQIEMVEISKRKGTESGDTEMTFNAGTTENRQDVESFSEFLSNQQNLFKSLKCVNSKSEDGTAVATDTNNNDNVKNITENAEEIKDSIHMLLEEKNCDASNTEAIMQLESVSTTNPDPSNLEVSECFELNLAANKYVTHAVPKQNEQYVLADLSNNAYLFLTLPKILSTPQEGLSQSEEFEEKSSRICDNSSTLVKKKGNKNVAVGSSGGKKKEIDKNSLRVLLLESVLKKGRVERGGAGAAGAGTEVDSTIPFSCITTPEVVASCNTTSSTAHTAVAVDPKPLQLGSSYRAVESLTGALAAPPAPLAAPATREQPRSAVSGAFNGLPLPRGYGAADDYKKSLDENGNAVQGISSPVSGSSQHKKPRRKKSSKNETVIKSHQIDGYQGNKDLNEVLRFIESNADAGRQSKLRGKHKDDDDKGKKRSAERRKDKEKVKRASSLEELSRTKLEDLTDAPEPPPAKPERRSWGDDARDAFYFRANEPEPAPAPDADFQTVTKRRKPRRRDTERDERAERDARRARLPEPRARRESAPPSDRSNDSNDDMDSVHSLPAPARAPLTAPAPPHASYADIARTRHNIPDLIESCNFYAEGEGGGDSRRSDPAPAPGDADGYPALEPRATAARRGAGKPPPSAAPRRDRKERAPAAAADCPAPDVVADRRPPVILLDSAARPRDMDGVTFGFDINEQLLSGPPRRPRCDLVRDAPDAESPAADAEAAPAARAAVAVLAGCAALRYVPPQPPPDTHHLHQIIDYVGAAWEDVIRCGAGKVRYFSE